MSENDSGLKLPCPKQCGGGHLISTGNITSCYHNAVFMHWELNLICNHCGFMFKLRIYDSEY